LFKTLRHHFTQGKRVVAACHGYLLTISVPNYILRYKPRLLHELAVSAPWA
jgi:uncharacterized membrane protein